MKDYTLSEQKTICEKNEHIGCRKCEIRDFCHNVRFKRPYAYDDIEPRDMIELPSVQKYEWVYPEASRNCVSYDVIYRDKYGQIQIAQDFDDEARANAFLERKKGGKA